MTFDSFKDVPRTFDATIGALTLKIKDGVTVVVPARLNRITTYVLAEQEDWFEKEIHFIRRFLKPGMLVIDIGANYGVYALTAAHAVGAEGKVWAFEPATATSHFLRLSRARNGFGNLCVIEAAVSSVTGSARLSIGPNPELNRLGATEDTPSEAVPVVTLDQAASEHRWDAIDFVKIDAEGEELNILRGAEQFLARLSPLVMFELKDGTNVKIDVVSEFLRCGWRIYRLPNPDGFLVPFDINEPVDGFELNLFACKPEQSARLARRGLLIDRVDANHAAASGSGLALLRRQSFAKAFPLRSSVDAPEIDPTYLAALDAYGLWRDGKCAPSQRYAALTHAFQCLKQLVETKATAPRLATFARVAWEAGARSVAARILAVLADPARPRLGLGEEPFWPAAPRFDLIDPGPQPNAWFMAAVIEQYERLRLFSSLYDRQPDLRLLDWLCSTPFASAEMERRRLLVRWRAGHKPVPPPRLANGTVDNLNAEFWRSGGPLVF